MASVARCSLANGHRRAPRLKSGIPVICIRDVGTAENVNVSGRRARKVGSPLVARLDKLKRYSSGVKSIRRIPSTSGVLLFAAHVVHSVGFYFEVHHKRIEIGIVGASQRINPVAVVNRSLRLAVMLHTGIGFPFFVL